MSTANTISEAIAACRFIKEIKKYIPGPKGGEIHLDGTRTLHERTSDKNKQKEMYSGKIKRHSLNTLLAVNQNDVIVWLGTTAPSSKHDVVMTPELGDTFTRMTNKWVQPEHTINVVIDLRFQGITKHLPCIEPILPIKKKKGKKLSPSEKRYNKKVSQRRVNVE